MADQKHLASRTAVLLIGVGLFIFLVYLYFFVPFDEVIEAIRKVNPFYFLLAFCTLFISGVFYSLTWQRLLKLLSIKVSFLKVFQFTWVESFVDLTVPAEPISGDVSRIYLMSKLSNGSAGKVTASVIGHRILTTMVTIGSLIVSTIYFVIRYKPPAIVLGFVALVAAGGAIYVGLLFYFSMRKDVAQKGANWLIRLLVRFSRGRWELGGLRKSAKKMLDAFYEGIAVLGGYPKGLILPLFFSIFAWLSDVLIAVLVFFALGQLGNTISPSAIVIVYSISVAIQYIPVGVIPGEVGLVEIVMTSLFAVLGNSSAIAVFAVATVLIRALTFWVRLLVGGITVQFLGIKSLVSSA
jgi:uncharacterized protein (TIRG00374 family)